MKMLYVIRKVVLFYNLWLATLAVIIACLLGCSWWLLTMIPLYWSMLHYAHFTPSVYGYPGRLVTWTAVEFNVCRRLYKMDGTYKDILSYWVKYEGRKHYLFGGISGFVENFTKFSSDYTQVLKDLEEFTATNSGVVSPGNDHE